MMIDGRDEAVFQRMLLDAIFNEIKTVRGDIKVMRTEQVLQGKEIAGLKVKSGIWGILGGAVATGAYALTAWLRGSPSG